MDVNVAFDELTLLIPIFGAGFGAGMLIGLGTWCAKSVVTVFRKFF